MGKIFFISDSHLKAMLFVSQPLMVGDTYRALDSVVSDIIKDRTKEKAVIFCGDIFDTKTPAPDELSVFQRAVKSLRDSDIAVFGIDGNHDKPTRNISIEDSDLPQSWLDVISGIERLDHKLVEIFGTRLYGLDYVQGVEVYDNLAEVPACDILVIHQPLEAISPFEAYTITPSDIPETVVRGVVAGHVHMVYKDDSSGITFLSPGATHAQKANQDKGTYAVYDNKKHTFKHIPVRQHRTMTRLECFTEAELKDLYEDLESLKEEDLIKRPYVQLKLKREVADIALSEIKDKFSETLFLSIQIVSDQQDVSEDYDFQELVNPAELLDKVAKHLEIKDKHVIEAAISLITNPNPLSVVSDIEARIMKEIEDYENQETDSE
jgi:DNA repair exonuclease SbcCD nuclease subunit